ncbi:hypothetical protein TWF718_010296 [Orbilia javanica]|uniref:O-fucosyltransferase family protein n=1 Tax=Orbilia javanica TaxID=47235 RepID=A0AAN8MJH0_9PEZI
MFGKVLGVQNKPRRSIYSLTLWTGLTFFFVAASTYFLSQTRPTVDYFHGREPKSEPSASHQNPLLTNEGIERFALDHGYPRLGESANFTSLRQLCDSTKWQRHVYFTCTHNLGGLMNVRNMVLNCVRYAIAAGASGLVMPQIEARDPTVLKHLKTGEYQKMSYLFDDVWFKKVMKENCGQLKLLDTFEDITNSGYATMPDLINIQALMGQPPGNRQGRLRNKKPWEFRPRFDKLVQSRSQKPSWRTPVIVRLDDKALFSFPPSFDSPELARNFGFILEFRLDLSALSNVIVNRARKTLNDRTGNDPYVGLHLRSEADAGKYWASWDLLANTTISVATKNDIKLIYVASGDTDGVAKLAKKAADLGIKVLNKWSVLYADEKEFLQPFRFDQQAIVDYLALMRSDRFIGSGQSSFSSHLILRRELLASISSSEEKGVEPESTPRDQLVGPGRLGYWDMDWP